MNNCNTNNCYQSCDSFFKNESNETLGDIKKTEHVLIVYIGNTVQVALYMTQII